MDNVKWIKLYTNVFDNRKIKQLESMPSGDEIIVIWLKLLCLAGNTNDKGLVYFTREVPYTEQMLATEFNRPLASVQMALDMFERFGMIEVIDDVLRISNWEKYQNVDRLEEIREYNRIAKQKSREKQRLLASVNDKSMTSQRCHETEEDIEEDKDKEKEKYKEKAVTETVTTTKTNRFAPPSVDDVRTYCEERSNNIDAEQFVDYYESKGWMIGKNKMKDWKAAVRTWERNGFNCIKTKENDVVGSSFDADEFFNAALRRAEND